MASLVVAWPQAQVSAMSIEGPFDVPPRVPHRSRPPARRQELIDDFTVRADAVRGADGFGIDDVIDPADIRAVLCDALATAPRRHRPAPPFGSAPSRLSEPAVVAGSPALRYT